MHFHGDFHFDRLSYQDCYPLTVFINLIITVTSTRRIDFENGIELQLGAREINEILIDFRPESDGQIFSHQRTAADSFSLGIVNEEIQLILRSVTNRVSL